MQYVLKYNITLYKYIQHSYQFLNCCLYKIIYYLVLIMKFDWSFIGFTFIILYSFCYCCKLQNYSYIS